jgi:hypothetical protein
MEPLVRYVFMVVTVSLLMQLVNARAQADLDSLISQVFSRPPTEETSNNPESTAQKKDPDEGPEQDPLSCQCVPYYLCQNNTIITDGVGLIDIRSGFLPSNLPCPCTAYNTPGWVLHVCLPATACASFAWSRGEVTHRHLWWEQLYSLSCTDITSKIFNFSCIQLLSSARYSSLSKWNMSVSNQRLGHLVWSLCFDTEYSDWVLWFSTVPQGRSQHDTLN